jgi:hypothetical protein
LSVFCIVFSATNVQKLHSLLLQLVERAARFDALMLANIAEARGHYYWDQSVRGTRESGWCGGAMLRPIVLLLGGELHLVAALRPACGKWLGGG